MRAQRIAAAALAGCAVAGCFYSPDPRDCAVSCGPGGACPSGTSCAEGVCRVPGAGGACELAACSDPDRDRATNFDPCELRPVEGDWIVTADGEYATDTGTGGGGAAGVLVTSGSVPLRVVHVARFEVRAGATLTIGSADRRDDVPLLIVAESATIAGTIRVLAGRDRECAAAPAPTQASQSASGGTGGGFGGTGGSGGGNTVVPIPGPSPRSGDAPLAPLRGGCSGRAGGVPTGTIVPPTAASSGGTGAGALQISARDTIEVTGTINANGAGGSAGIAYSAGCSNLGCRLGGGGGGSGGGVFLEASTIHLQPTARICANGGGGGGGSSTQGNSVHVADPTPEGECAEVAARGGRAPDLAKEAFGGDGGYGAAVDGLDAATNSANSNTGGGGGGGGAGRIRLRAGLVPIEIGAVVSPPPFTQ
jgi:hypothetical protein